MIRKVIKWLLRFTAFGHVIEIGMAVYETAYITASLALMFAIIELIGSFYIGDN